MKNPDSLVEIQVQVEPGAKGLRADVYLARHLGRISRSRILAMFKAGRVHWSGSPIRPAHRLQGGETLVLYKPAPQEKELPFVEVVFQDDALVVVNKPGDLTVHPTANALHCTLTAFLRTLGPYTPAHRLDRETSGLVACARTGGPSANLKEQFASQATRKVYLGIVRGTLENTLEIREPLAFDASSPIRIKMAVTPGGMFSHSTFIPLAAGRNATLVAGIPHTGRQHQLRAHLEWAGFPLFGDKIYGVAPKHFLQFIETGWTPELARDLLFERHMLHAAYLFLRHPATGRPMEFAAAPPDDFREACRRLDIETPAEAGWRQWIFDCVRRAVFLDDTREDGAPPP